MPTMRNVSGSVALEGHAGLGKALQHLLSLRTEMASWL